MAPIWTSLRAVAKLLKATLPSDGAVRRRLIDDVFVENLRQEQDWSRLVSALAPRCLGPGRRDLMLASRETLYANPNYRVRNPPDITVPPPPDPLRVGLARVARAVEEIRDIDRTRPPRKPGWRGMPPSYPSSGPAAASTSRDSAPASTREETPQERSAAAGARAPDPEPPPAPYESAGAAKEGELGDKVHQMVSSLAQTLQSNPTDSKGFVRALERFWQEHVRGVHAEVSALSPADYPSVGGPAVRRAIIKLTEPPADGDLARAVRGRMAYLDIVGTAFGVHVEDVVTSTERKS